MALKQSRRYVIVADGQSYLTRAGRWTRDIRLAAEGDKASMQAQLPSLRYLMGNSVKLKQAPSRFVFVAR